MDATAVKETRWRWPRVAVIGAGMAGISAANHLVESGLDNVIVLEARERLGGRIHTIMHDGNILEMGAEWIHGGCVANTVFNLAVRHNLVGDKIKLFHGDLDPNSFPGHFHRSDGKVISADVVLEANSIYGAILDDSQNYHRDQEVYANMPAMQSLADFYTSRSVAGLEKLRETGKSEAFVEDVSCVMNAYRNGMATYVGDELDQASLRMYGSSLELPGGDVVVPAGLKSIVDSLAEPLLRDKIKLNSVVTKITCCEKDRVMLEYVNSNTGQTDSLEVDYVITTIPLGVLKRKHSQLFMPPLPIDKITALKNMGEGGVAKIFLKWTKPWWKLKPFGITLAWSEKELAEEEERPWWKGVFAFNDVEAQPNLLVCFTAGHSARLADQLPDDEVLDRLGELIRTFSGDPTVPLPTKLLRTRWTAEEFTMGSYSQPRIDMVQKDLEVLARPVPSLENPRILFAGEAYNPAYWSNMHGARLSGLREAERILLMNKNLNRSS